VPPALQVRAWLGIPNPENAAALDSINIYMASAFLLYALFVLLTGKRLFK
jgi:hypothetical protein